MNDLGYKSVAIGKWHLGSHRRAYTPTMRGFSSHLGYWTGRIDYYDHTAEEMYNEVVRKIRFELPFLCMFNFRTLLCFGSKAGARISAET